MAVGGRSSKLTPETQQTILECVADGMPYRFAAAQVGICEHTLHGWMRKGRRNQGKQYVTFLTAIKKAESEFIRRNAARVEDKAVTSWQAAAWLLERRFPDEYGTGRNEVAELKKQVSGLIKVINNGYGKGTGKDRKADVEKSRTSRKKKP